MRLARIVGQRLRVDAPTPGFARLLAFQATGAAGDALIALALAGSLFFSVPEADARDRVALYLLLTVAPFAVVAPLLSRTLDRHRGSLRIAAVLTALGRGTFAWWLTTRLDSLLLFPIAFGLLVLSRAVLVIRGAALPDLVPPQMSLVQANASLSKMNALAGMAAVGPGLLLMRSVGPGSEAMFAVLVFFAGALPAALIPSQRGRRSREQRREARGVAYGVELRQALVAIGGMRLLVGFLVFHLAFAVRREDLGSIGLGLLVGAAAFGSLVGALVAPRLRRVLREEGILAASLGIAGLVGIVAGRWFSLPTAVLLVFSFGVAAGAAKVAFDSIVQRETPEGARGWAFARFEARLQLAWVVGAAIPLIVPIPSGPGAAAAGVIANLVGLLYILARRRVHQRRALRDQS
ncbi:MAG: MFS transporter [Actinobacteria bacterium]|nr:MFS transporter [Actinomycetota bacterium]